MRILERGLRAHGYEVVCADVAEHAMALSKDELLRCVVLDRALPATPGKVLREHLRVGGARDGKHYQSDHGT